MKIEELLQDFVNEPSFFESLVTEINSCEKPEVRFKLKMELLSYVAPKVKTRESESDSKPTEINIQFVGMDED